jgi:hypothetical protein
MKKNGKDIDFADEKNSYDLFRALSGRLPG